MMQLVQTISNGTHSPQILVATDNHIGYGERDPIRGRDSIETFREILQLARDHEVDGRAV